jgi:Planctomycete cytochrome C
MGKSILITSLLLVCCIFQHCKQESIETPQTIRIHSNQQTVTINDSLQLTVNGTNETYTWEIKPNIGSITATNFYKAPSSLYQNNTPITIQLKTQTGKESFLTLTIVRGNSNDSIISFATTIQPLFIQNCNFTACHGNGSRAGNVELSKHTNTINHLVVYQPLQSQLYLSLLKSDPLRIMPPAGPLHNTKISTIKKWIEQGALNN